MSRSNDPPFSVVIPAYNEEAVIGRCLAALLADAPAGREPEIIVACNGCSDATAARARQAAPNATVIEIAQGSKPLALNMGNAAASTMPRFFVDADVVVSYHALLATAAVLRERGVMVAAPAIAVDMHDTDAGVRAYYKVWLGQPYVSDGMVGSGVYGLSAEGLATVGVFPSIIADDGYVRTRFAPAARRRVSADHQGAPIYFTIFPPRTLGDLLRIEGRRRAGDAELANAFPTPQVARSTSSGTLRRTIGNGTTVVDVTIYLAIKSIGRLRHRWNARTGRGAVWHRDESSRQA